MFLWKQNGSFKFYVLLLLSVGIDFAEHTSHFVVVVPFISNLACLACLILKLLACEQALRVG